MSVDFTVDLDVGPHDVFRQLVKKLWEIYGMRIEEVSISWVDTSTFDRQKFTVEDLKVTSTVPGVGV